MGPLQQYYLTESRREFLKQSGAGIGAMALVSMFNEQLFAAPKATDPSAPQKPHFTAKAEHVIYIHLVGGASQLELFNHKPE